MPKTQNVNLPKMVLVLTKTIFTFFVISILIYLNFIELKENNNNRTYLNILKDIDNRYRSSDLLFKNYELKRLDTLKVTNPPLYLKHLNSRIALVKTLNSYGALINRSSKGGIENRNNVILLMSNDSISKTIKSNIKDVLPVFTEKKVNYNDYNVINHKNDDNINNALDIFKLFPRMEEVELLTAIDTISLKQQLDSLQRLFAPKNEIIQKDSSDTILLFQRKGLTYNSNIYKSGEYDKGTGGPMSNTYTNEETGKKVDLDDKNALFLQNQTFNGLCLYKNAVIISITNAKNYGHSDNSFGNNGGQGDYGRVNYTIVIPAETETIHLPSTLIFAGYSLKNIEELYDENKQSDLRNEYGNAKLDLIDEISIDIYKRNNSPISILGFELSRKWFPIALFCMITIISFILFNSIKASRKSGVLLETRETNDDVLSFLVDNKMIRLLLWVITSPLIFFLVLSSSPINYSNQIFYSLLFCCVLSTSLNIISYMWSLKMSNKIQQ